MQSAFLNITLSCLSKYLQIIGIQRVKCTAYGLPILHIFTFGHAFCPHPDTRALSQGIGCPHGALLVNWSGSDYSLVHLHWKHQMRRSTNAFIFIRGAQEKVSGRFCAADMVIKKALKPDDFLFLFVVLYHIISVLGPWWSYIAGPLIMWHFCAVLAGLLLQEMPTI